MAELHFFATETDPRQSFQCSFLSIDASLSLRARPPPLNELTTLAAVLRVLEKAEYDPRFFVLSPKWQREPLSIHAITKEGKIPQYIRPRFGGPAFDYLARRPRPIERTTQIVASWFADYPNYYSEQPSGEIARPVIMFEAFRAVRRCINRGGKRTIIQEVPKPGPIAMAGAREAYNNGSWLRAGDWHHVPKNVS